MWDQLKDHTNARFGKITLAWPVGRTGKRLRPSWLAFCDCGIFFIVRASNLSGNRTQSCGCARKETLSKLRYRHGHSPTNRPCSPEYRTWANMIQRCSNLDDPYYGGRGIKVCDRWHDFKNFIEDMGQRPSGRKGMRAEYSIDRINNDGNYEPGNCKWSTRKEQTLNRRITKHG